MAKQQQKRVKYLEDLEYVLKRPTIYVGSVENSDETIPIIENGTIVQKQKSMSIGFYKLLNEIVDNAFDEAIRCGGKMKTISVDIYTKTNLVLVKDTGNGFYQGYEKNEKTGLSDIETAFTFLKAGTNFDNDVDDTKETLIGMNGVGASIVNMLSDMFEVSSGDGKKRYNQCWEKFVSKRKTLKDDKVKGTTVSFIPRKDMFVDCVWDKEIVHTLFSFKNYNKNVDPILKKLEFKVRFDGEYLDLNIPFFPEDSMKISSSVGEITIYKAFPSSTNVSYVNMAQCKGTHQTILNEYFNTLLADDKAQEFYRTYIVLNLEPKLVVFGEQNKTTLKTKKNILEPVLEKEFKSKIRQLFGKSSLLADIKKAIEESRLGSQHKKLDKIKSSKLKISSKYFPASKKKEIIFLVEGDSAVGALNQKRDIKTMSSYAMKGKIANIKKVADILKDTELTELITILGLDIKGEKKPKYEKIVIAADSDVDGMHVSSLILNFFYTWFQNVIRDGHLYELTTPLVTAELGKKKYYFYYMHEWEKAKNKANYKNIQYHKGLGSLTEEDWEYVFENDLNLVQFTIDEEAEKNINLIFREEAKKRKEWMMNSCD